MFNPPTIRKVFEGVTSRHEMYALFNRHSQSPFDDDRINGTRYVGEWFEITEADHDHMFEILPPLFTAVTCSPCGSFWPPASPACSSL